MREKFRLGRHRTNEMRFAPRVTESLSGNDEPKLPSTSLTVEMENGTATRDFTWVSWRNNHRVYVANVLTTHPHFVESMREKGPTSIEDYVEEHGSVDVLTIDAPRRTGRPQIDPHDTRYAHRLVVDAKEGSMTVYPKERSRIADGKVDESVHWHIDAIQNVNSEPWAVYSEAYPNIFYTQLEQQIKPLNGVFTALGYRFGGDEDPYTILLPTTFERKYNALRQTDTTSGIYYPEIQVFNNGWIPYESYMQSLAQGKHPVGKESFFHYTHDSASGHIKAYMVYGEPLMDFVSRYAQSHQDTPHPELGPVIRTVDLVTDYMGNRRSAEQLLEDSVFHFNTMLTSIAKTGNVEDLQIVSWMRNRGILHEGQEVSGQNIKKAFVARAHEHFNPE